jgi:hypothetical protein
MGGAWGLIAAIYAFLFGKALFTHFLKVKTKK